MGRRISHQQIYSHLVQLLCLTAIYGGMLMFFNQGIVSSQALPYTVGILILVVAFFGRYLSFLWRCIKDEKSYDSLVNNRRDIISCIKDTILRSTEGDNRSARSELFEGSAIDFKSAVLGALSNYGVKSTSFTARCIWNVALANQSGTHLEIEEILHQNVDPEFDKNYSTLTVGASICFAIGIFGTFAGMMHVIQGDVTIVNLVGGLQEAIGSSLVGVISAIFFYFVSKIAYSYEVQFRRSIGEVILSTFFRDFQTSNETIFSDQAALRLGEKIGLAVSNEVKNALSGAIGDLKHCIEGLSQKIDDSMNDLFGPIKKITGRVEEISDTIIEQFKNLPDTLRHMDDMTNAINKAFNTMQEEIRGFAHNLGDNSHMITGANEKLMLTLERMEACSERMRSDFKSWIEYHPLQEMVKQLTKVSEHLETAGKSYGNVDETLKHYIDTFVTNVGNTIGPLEEKIKLQSHKIEYQTETISKIQKNFEDSAKQLSSVNQNIDKTAKIMTQTLTEEKKDVVIGLVIKRKK